MMARLGVGKVGTQDHGSCHRNHNADSLGVTEPGPARRFEKTMRRNGFKIEEIGIEDQFSLETAQEAALPVLAKALAEIIRSRLDNGQYIVENGLVKPRKETDCE